MTRSVLARRWSVRSCWVTLGQPAWAQRRLTRVTRFALTNVPLLYKRNRGSSITGGRKDLMAHHAFVAFKAASEEPRLLPLVARRLSERARKLGNHRFLLGDNQEATSLLRLATRLDLLNWRAWISLTVSGLFAGLAYRLLETKLRARRRSLGVKD